MQALILRSVPGGSLPGPYTACMDTAYADRLIGHLSDKGAYCSACQEACIGCRRRYDLDRTASIAGVIPFPSVLPVLIDEPGDYLPESVPAHDVLVAVGVHEQVLIAFVERFAIARALIVPQEKSDWISPYAVKTLTGLCRERGIECAFPKPFCGFNPADGVLKQFQALFRIGRPAIGFELADGRVTRTAVECSAPCGATYYVARNLEGRPADRELLLKADMLLAAYPCTADHSIDREFNDSITHEAVKIQCRMLVERLPDREDIAAVRHN